MKFSVLVAGGTGGHINAALAIGTELEKNRYNVLFVTGKRPLDYKLYQGKKTLHLNSTTLRSKNLLKLVLGFFDNFIVFLQVFWLFLKKRPQFILGAGGYICGPVLLAGFFLGVPIYILEQNSVMGLTNKILAIFSKKVFVHFKNTKGFSKTSKIVLSGNPVRSEVENFPFSNEIKQPFSVLIFGGSLGATAINAMTEKLIQKDFGFPLEVKHQTGILADNVQSGSSHRNYQRVAYLEHIEKDYDRAHLIICRAGASTVSELRYVQKPVIFIPYPLATDNHQVINAQNFKLEVDFPVYIHSVEELEENDFALLRKIFNEVKLFKRSGKFLPFKRSTQVITQTILSDITGN